MKRKQGERVVSPGIRGNETRHRIEYNGIQIKERHNLHPFSLTCQTSCSEVAVSEADLRGPCDSLEERVW
jgi:hypothetical protein